MKKVISNRSRMPRNCARRGTAQVELALFLPTYVAAILILLTIFSYARTRGRVSVETRHSAWMQRDRFGNQTDALDVGSAEAASVGRILAGSQDPTGGLVGASKSGDATIFLKSLDLMTSIQMEHHVLTDPWDHRVIPFETKSEHPRLVLARRTLVFGGLDIGVMRELASAAASGAAEAAGLNGQLAQQRNDARQKIAAAKRRVEQEIEQREDDVDRLEDELRDLEREVPPDEDRIEQVRSRINDLNREIERLEQKIVELRQAAAFVG